MTQGVQPTKAHSSATAGSVSESAPADASRENSPLIRPRFFEEFKRRNLVRVALLYLIACWVVLEPTHVVFHMLEVPPWANRLVIVLMAIGFPLVLLFSWIYEITPRGLKLTSEVDRAQSITHETGRKLDRAIIVVLSVALLYFVADKFWLSRPSAPDMGATAAAASGVQPSAPPGPNDKSIAVLPFADMSEKKDQEYFSDGLAEELLDLLAKMPELHVIARTSSFAFKGKSDDIPTIAHKLNVANVLEGSVRKSGARLRVTTQLIRAGNGEHIWSETYDRELKDVFRVQDEIAAAVVAALRVHLLASQQVANAYRTESSEAHDHYLLGKLLLSRGATETLMRATEEFRTAIRLDPKYAIAFAGLADAESIRADQVGDAAMMRSAVADADRAVSLAPDLAEVYSTRGFIRYAFLWDWPGSQTDFEKAMSLDPGASMSQRGYSILLMARGRPSDAVTAYRRAVEADPLSSVRWTGLASTQWEAGDLAGARQSLHRALELSPESEAAYFQLGMTELLDGHAQAALEAFRQVRFKPGHLFGMAVSEQALGHKPQAQQALQELIAVGAQGEAYQIAVVYAFRGEPNKAFQWLERAYAQRDGGMTDLKTDPFLRNLHADPRFRVMLVKMKMSD